MSKIISIIVETSTSPDLCDTYEVEFYDKQGKRTKSSIVIKPGALVVCEFFRSVFLKYLLTLVRTQATQEDKKKEFENNVATLMWSYGEEFSNAKFAQEGISYINSQLRRLDTELKEPYDALPKKPYVINQRCYYVGELVKVLFILK
jgi:hypothetical protein